MLSSIICRLSEFRVSESGEDHVFRDHLIDVLRPATVDVGHDAGWLMRCADTRMTTDMLTAARINAGYG